MTQHNNQPATKQDILDLQKFINDRFAALQTGNTGGGYQSGGAKQPSQPKESFGALRTAAHEGCQGLVNMIYGKAKYYKKDLDWLLQMSNKQGNNPQIAIEQLERSALSALLDAVKKELGEPIDDWKNKNQSAPQGQKSLGDDDIPF